jgi:hypothetical protein
MTNLITIQEKIYEIRNQKVMLDFDLAELYQVETKVLNQAVKRNVDRFPKGFPISCYQKRMGLSKVTNCDLRKREGQIPQIFTLCFY